MQHFFHHVHSVNDSSCNRIFRFIGCIVTSSTLRYNRAGGAHPVLIHSLDRLAIRACATVRTITFTDQGLACLLSHSGVLSRETTVILVACCSCRSRSPGAATPSTRLARGSASTASDASPASNASSSNILFDLIGALAGNRAKEANGLIGISQLFCKYAHLALQLSDLLSLRIFILNGLVGDEGGLRGVG